MLNNEKIKREEGDDGIDKKVTEEILQVQGNINEEQMFKFQEILKCQFQN